MRVTKSDRFKVTLFLPDVQGNSVAIKTRSSKERSEASQYLRDLGRALRGDANALAPWRGKKIAGVELFTDESQLARPDDDIFPVRAVYNGTTQNIGLNYLTSNQPIWFAGPDIISSILLTGRVPHIEKAIRVVPHGKQPELGSTSLRGMVDVDAANHSLFKHVVEQRAAHESDKALHYWLKILASSGSYGLFVELNPNDTKAKQIKVFSGEEFFETSSDVLEEPGKWFAPHIASLITAGGRLLLAMLERSISDAGGAFLFCDTDSAAIVSAKQRKRIAMPDGAKPITATFMV